MFVFVGSFCSGTVFVVSCIKGRERRLRSPTLTTSRSANQRQYSPVTNWLTPTAAQRGQPAVMNIKVTVDHRERESTARKKTLLNKFISVLLVVVVCKLHAVPYAMCEFEILTFETYVKFCVVWSFLCADKCLGTFPRVRCVLC